MSVIAFEIVLTATEVGHRFRVGVASDHMRVVARALRSAAAADLIGLVDGGRGWEAILDDTWAQLAELSVIEGVSGALAQLHADPDIPDRIKVQLPQPA